jgi:hypothetical protein
MTPRRLLLNIATAAVLTLLVLFLFWAHLSTLVVPERERGMAQIDFEPGAWKEMR